MKSKDDMGPDEPVDENISPVPPNVFDREEGNLDSGITGSIPYADSRAGSTRKPVKKGKPNSPGT